MKPLSHKQLAFVREHLRDPESNGSAAASRAGYGAPGSNTSRVAASRLMRNPLVKAALLKAETRALEASGVTAERVIREVARIAFNDAREFFDAFGNLKPISELSDDAAAALAGVDVHTHTQPGDEDEQWTTKKVKFWDKNTSLEKLMKKLALYPAGKADVGPDGKPIQPITNNYIVIPAKEPKGAAASKCPTAAD